MYGHYLVLTETMTFPGEQIAERMYHSRKGAIQLEGSTWGSAEKMIAGIQNWPWQGLFSKEELM